MSSGVHFSGEVTEFDDEGGSACSDLMKQRCSQSRQLTLFQNASYEPDGVQFVPNPSLDMREDDEDSVELFASADNMNRRRSRSRRLTPFQYGASTQNSVQFGLTEVLDLDGQTDSFSSRRRPSRVNSGIFVSAVALPSDALGERVQTPRASPIEETDDISYDSYDNACVMVNRRAFEHNIPSCHCSSPDECAVCHECFGTEEAKLFPCGHYFHASCILAWFERQLSCPLCRRSFVQELALSSPDVNLYSSAQPVLQRATTF